MHQQLTSRNNVYYLSSSRANFEEAYIAVREKEGRVLKDEETLSLPHLSVDHPKWQEWKKRNFTVRNIIGHIVESAPVNVLDLGCGNGWFTNVLAQETTASVIGADINVTELEQAARLFGSESCHFIYGDIFSDQWPQAYFDIITLNACIQYFPDLDQLLDQLMKLLTDKGEIHVLDSPFYPANEMEKAKQRTISYYQQQGVDAMISYYHHHSWEVLEKHQAKVLFQPNSLTNKIKRKLNKNISPFPWVMIKKR